MRPIRSISAEEEGFRIDESSGFACIKRNPIEPEPVGTIIMTAFRVVGYDQDCDGSLMARLEQIDKDGQASGWIPDHIGLYPESDLVVTLEEWRKLFK